MDLAEKRKQLEALRAARQAKQQVVEQYMTSRSSNASVALNASQASISSGGAPSAAGVAAPSKAPASPTPAAAAAAPSPRPSGLLAKPPRSSSAATPSPPPVSSQAAVTATRRTSSPATTKQAAAALPSSGGPLTPPPSLRDDNAKSAAPRASGEAPSGGARASSRPPPAPSSASSKSLASPRDPHAIPGAATPMIHVLAVSNADASTSAPSDRPSGTPRRSTPPAAATTAAATPLAARRPSPMRPSAEDSGAPPRQEVAAPDVRGGWGVLQYCTRSSAAANAALQRSRLNEASTSPVGVFNPAVALGDAASASGGGERRRVILEATASLVPYEGAAAALLSSGSASSGDSTIWSVCVAATYGASKRSFSESTGSAAVPAAGGGDYQVSSAQRRGSLESATVGLDAHSGRGAGGGRSADAALAGVRASMECGYPWGSASAVAAQSTVPGTTMDAALKVARESPGLVLAWFIVPLPASAAPRKEGTLFAEGSAGPFAAATPSRGGGAASAGVTPDYVVVVLPLVCDSEVTTLLAHPFQPSTLLGGTRCGRVVQWSMGQAWAQAEPRRLVERALATTGTPTTLLLPPQRPSHSTFPSPQAHQGPVLRLAIHGDATCHHLYSISQEGRVCTWPAWQPTHPTASCSSYVGIRPMGHIGVDARFVERAGTDAMTQVFIGTTSGAVLVGANRDAKSIELQYYGPSRQLPSSSTVIRTLDVTACPLSAAVDAVAPHAAASSFAHLAATASESPTVSANRRTSQPPPASPPPAVPPLPGSQHPHPHRGRIVSMSLQTATHGFRGQDCVVTAASDGTCAAWFHRTVVPLEGFSAAVTSVCWSPTKPGVLAAGDTSGLVTVWSVGASISTPVATVSLQEASRRTRGSATSDAVLWVVAGPSDAAGFGGGAEEDDGDIADDGDPGASLGQTDAVGAAISSIFFSRDGRWLFASTACGYVYSLRVSSAYA